jgi:hypothetical protein
LVVVILIRYGLLAMMTTILVTDLLSNFLFTWDFRSWYGTTSLLAVSVVLGIALYGFRTSVRTAST